MTESYTDQVRSGRAKGARLTDEQAQALKRAWQRKLAEQWDEGRTHLLEVAIRNGLDANETMHAIAWGLLQLPQDEGDKEVRVDDLIRHRFYKPRPKPQQEG